MEQFHATTSVKNVDVYYNRSLAKERQVKAISSARYDHIRIRQYVATDTCKTLVHAFVTSRLD